MPSGKGYDVFRSHSASSLRHVIMRIHLLLVVAFIAACASAKPKAAAPSAGLQIKLTTIYVDDQEKALRFYTDVMGFVKKDDVTNGPYRWITVRAAADPNGTELQLALHDNPAAKAFQQAMFAQAQPAAMFYTNDINADYARIKARGIAFEMPPTEVMPGSTIATFHDTCGNLIQITQLVRE